MEHNNLSTKALLLLDNCLAHNPNQILSSRDGMIKVMFLPPNVTGLIQPMVQNPINIVKLTYRNNLLTHIVANNELDLSHSLKSITIRDAILNLTLAWNKLLSDVIKKSWSQLFMDPYDDEFTEEDNIPLNQLINDYSEVIQDSFALLQEINPIVNFLK